MIAINLLQEREYRIERAPGQAKPWFVPRERAHRHPTGEYASNSSSIPSLLRTSSILHTDFDFIVELPKAAGRVRPYARNEK
ncbi:hypothetical protein HT136_25075 [Novosphingobium profundi]|nr:hypothetical protein [Novosphingobium profundi]